MKAYLSFNLDKPEDRDSHKEALKAWEYKFVLQDFANYLRNLERSDKRTVKVEEVKEEFFRFLNERDLNIYD